MSTFKVVSIVAVLAILCAFVSWAQGEMQEQPLRGGTGTTSDGDRYIIGPEDVLAITAWGEPALSQTLTVRMDGKISLPFVKEMEAAGLTPLQLQEILVQKLEDFINSPEITVAVKEANSFRVYVSGQIRTPGVYRLKSETTLVQIIPVAGGFTEWAKKRKIVIMRKDNTGETRILANYNKIVDGREPNIILKAGDTVIVP